MEVERLYKIDPVSTDRPASVVSKEVITLFRSEFKYNILELTQLLCCQRDWVEDNILPAVEHIHLNRFFRDYVIQQTKDLTEKEFSTLSKGHYFFSEKDFARFWKENAAADKKTNIIDLANYVSSRHSLKELDQERQRHQACLRLRQEKDLHRDHMQVLLTDEGYELFLAGQQGKFEWSGVKTPSWEQVCGKLVSETIYRRQCGYTTSSAAHVRLARSGATRIKLFNKTLWLPTEPVASNDLFWPYPVQA